MTNSLTEEQAAKHLVRQKAATTSRVGVIGRSALPTRQKADESFDPDNPPEEYADAIEADDFLIYGKASIEQHDLEDQRISIEALEQALDRFFESEDAPGIISRGHADVPVGMPVREHELEEDTTLNIDGETYEFDAGDTIQTETKDADDDQRPELWLVSRLASDSDIARETRYKVLTGELNGYSVTIKPHDGARRRTDDGEDILSVDLHAVTIGTDEAIRNQGSEFDVAEFKAGPRTLGDIIMEVEGAPRSERVRSRAKRRRRYEEEDDAEGGEIIRSGLLQKSRDDRTLGDIIRLD